MKNHLLIISLLIFISCTNTAKQEEPMKIPFLGTWTRSFELAKDSTQHVYYTIWADSIQYEMQGPLPVKYVMQKDSFVVEDNRWVGKLNDVPYVIFIKNASPDSITLFKKQVTDMEEALSMQVPSDTVSSHFASWNVYKRRD